MSLKLNTPSGGSVTLTVADTVSHTTKVVAGKEELAGSNGAALVGYLPAGVGAVASTVQGKLRESVSVKDFGAVGDGVTDDTAAVQAAVTAVAGKKLWFPSGTYIIDSVLVNSSVNLVCDVGVIFKRKANSDTASGSYWITGAAMFEVGANGVKFKVSDFTYDGNNVNQTTTEPTGFFVKTAPPAVVGSEPITVQVSRGVFIGGTSGYLLLRGDDVNRRYETFALVEDCRFYNTIKGKGKGDPSTPNALGYLPTYVYVLDYVRINTMNFHAEWNGVLTTGEYAACALNGTFAGTVYANSGESYIYMHGTTYVKGVGRSARKYNDDNEWVTNNGIGAIDCYGNADTLFIEKLVASNCQNVAARAKGSLKIYTILDATLTNCHRGLQVGPSTTGACETSVYVGTVHATGGTVPQVEFVGTSSGDILASVAIGNAYIAGPHTNPESMIATDGALRIRNVAKLHIGSAGVFNTVTAGISIHTVNRSVVDSLTIDQTGNEGLMLTAGDSHVVKGFDIRRTSAPAISVGTNPGKVVFRDGRISDAVNYGIFNNTTTSKITVTAVDLITISGTGRGFYTGGSPLNISNCSVTGVATPLFAVTGALVNESENSWNPVTRYSTITLTTTGTWRVGDIVWNTAPTAGGTLGWICTTAGTPGTWKTFGAIAA